MVPPEVSIPFILVPDLVTDVKKVLSPERRLELRNPDNAAAAATVIMGSKIILATRALLTCVYVAGPSKLTSTKINLGYGASKWLSWICFRG